MQSAPFKLLLQNNSQKDQKRRRSHEEIQLLSELCINSKIFEYLGLAKNSLRQICDKIILIWADNPHASQISQNQIYFVLEGKAFQYLHNSSLALKERLHHNQDYLMVRKLGINDFFIVYSPPGKYTEQHDYKKYQLMIDQKSLIGKISGDSFKQHFLPLIEQRWKKITLFLRKIQMFESLPLMMLYEVSKYMELITCSQGTQIINRAQPNQFVYFIVSGEVQSKIFDESKIQKSPNKNYQVKNNKSFKRVILKNNQIFGIDAFHTHTYQQLEMQYSAQAKANCILYKIDKRILAIVISSFENISIYKTKLMSSVNLNDQIQGQGYKTADMAMLSRNVDKIKTSQKRIRDIKLRFYDTSHRNRMGKAFQELDKNEEPLDTGLDDIKYQSCENFNNIRVSKDRNKKFYQTMNAKAHINNSPFFNQETKHKMSSVIFSVYDQDQFPTEPVNTKRKSFTSGFYRAAVPTTSFGKRRSDANLPSGGKQQTDIIRTYLQRKLKNQMLKKAQLILQRNKQKNIHNNTKVKRIYSLKSIKSNSNQKIEKKQIGQQLFERMNKIIQTPLLSQIEGERKKLEKQALKIMQNKQKSVKKIINKKEQKEQSGNKELILIRNN